jgi:FkbM family methyltransferase
MATDILAVVPGIEKISILDIGANSQGEGTEPYYGLAQQGMARVIGFEPDAKGCAELNQMYGARGDRYFPHFVGDGSPRVFHETNWALTGSLYPPNVALLQWFNGLYEVTTPVAQHPVSTVRLDDIEIEGGVDLLKIDIQGAELDVFKGGRRTLQDVLVIQTEVEFIELYQGQPLFAEVDTFLRAQGFFFHTFLGFGQRAFKPLVFPDQPSRGIRQYIWSDAVYFRHPDDWKNLSIAQLKKMFLIMSEMYQSADVCMRILETIRARNGEDYLGAYLEKLRNDIAAV